jgi:peptide/nickel transport system substrate-binding protein
MIKGLKTKRRLGLSVLGAAALLTTSVAGVSVSAQRAPRAIEDVPREETVIFDTDSASLTNPFNFNYMVPGNDRNHGYHQAMMEPLFILNYETGEIEPWLGLEMTPNEDLTVWTLKIREGVKWQDGEAFNADDVVFTINLLKDGAPEASEAANIQQWVESVEKIDDLTVQFNLTGPNPRFQLDHFSVRIWGSVMILPEHIWAGKDQLTYEFYDPDAGLPMGTGPYTLTSASETEMVWDRDDDWWGAQVGFQDLPAPRRLIWVITGPEETKAALASESELDSVMDITLGALEAIQARNPNVIAWLDEPPYAWFDPCPRQLSLNHTVEPWGEADVRKAISLAIDRNEIVDIAYEGTTVPSRSMFVEYAGLLPYIEDMEAAGIAIDPAADVEGAAALMEGAGFERNGDGMWERDGDVLSLDIQTNETFIEKRRIAEVLVEQLREFGIDASTRAVASATWEDNNRLGNYEGTLDWDACGSVNEPWYSMNRYHEQFVVPVGEPSPNLNNHVRWTNARYSELVDEIGVLPLGDPAIAPLVAEAMQIWSDEMPFIPITQARKIVPFDTTYWVGWPTAENNYNHPATWWNSTHMIIHNLQPAG